MESSLLRLKEEALKAYVTGIKRKLSDGNGVKGPVSDLIRGYQESRDHATSLGMDVRHYDFEIKKALLMQLVKIK